MPADRDEFVAEIFHQAADLPEPERTEFLDQRCADDSALRAEIEGLLAADACGNIESFLTPPAFMQGGSGMGQAPGSFAMNARETVGPEAVPDGATVGAGTRIGRYRIQRVIASGGMGTVYEAAQEQPRRTVALKVIRAGAASPMMLRRFEYEAQVLGSLQHPGIAQVYEAGTHPGEGPDGRDVPFIAMELIAGARSLIDYAVAADLDLRGRIGLMALVCDAVQYAHQRGVIHRDLKPGNILVDSGGLPKIIDFGVARVTGLDITAATQHTGGGQLMGTLRYMSPEQCEGDSRKIDTRSDVYALGVVLYELLTGRLPYDLSSGSIVTAPRIIREVAPTRPSSIRQVLRGDVETIVLKALEKDPDRRYQSAGEVAADLRRWLADEPIHARPPSAVYQLRMLARRNRPLVAGMAATVLALVGGTIATSWQAVRATRQRDLARQAGIVADEEKVKAKAEAETSRRITDFFENLLASADPETARGRAITVQELVDRAAANIGDTLKGQPLVEAGVRAALGKTYVGLGDYPKAEVLLREAIRLRQEDLGLDAPSTLEVRGDLATVYWMQGKLDRAIPEFRAVLQGTQSHFGPSGLEYYQALDALATALAAHGDTGEAIQMNQTALDGYRRLLGNEDLQTVMSQNNLAYKFDATGRSAEAEPLFREAVAAARKLQGSDHPDTLSYIASLANCLRVLGKLDEAETLAHEALDTRRRIYPPGHPLTGDTCELIGRIMCKRGDGAGAVPYLIEAVDNHRHSLPEGNWRTAVSAAWLGIALTQCRRYDEAEGLLLEAHGTLQRTKGQHPPQEAGVIRSLVDLYKAWGKPERAAEFGALVVPPP